MTVVLDNIVFSLQRAGGISGMWAILIRELLKHNDIEIRFIERPDARRNIFRRQLDIPEDLILNRKHLPLLFDRYRPVTLSRTQVAELTAGGAPFIFHSSYYRTCRNPQARNVVTLHDFIYEKLPEVHSALANRMHTGQKSATLRKADAIVSVSSFTEGELKERYPDLKTQLAVVPNCTVNRSALRKNQNLRKYLLFVGGRESYKRFDLAVEVAKLSGIPLYICGAPLTKNEKRILNGSDYKSFLFPDENKMAELYSGATALLYLSTHEGFGIPVLEAQRFGCPVIIGDCPVTARVSGSMPLIANTVEEALAHLEHLKDPQFRTSVIEAGHSNEQRYTPSGIADSYLDLYKRTLQI